MISSYVCKHTGDGSDGNLSKVQFARILDGKLVYDDGKNDHYVFGGMLLLKCVIMFLEV